VAIACTQTWPRPRSTTLMATPIPTISCRPVRAAPTALAPTHGVARWGEHRIVGACGGCRESAERSGGVPSQMAAAAARAVGTPIRRPDTGIATRAVGGAIATVDFLLVVAQSIAIDLGFVASKLCTLVLGEKLRKKIATLSDVTIGGTLAGSAGMKVYAFTAQAPNPYGSRPRRSRACDLFAFMRLGATLWFDCQNRTV
jgi:hypothetical protein